MELKVTRYLAILCDSWESDVLGALGVLAYERATLSTNHPYFQKRKAAIRYGTKRVLEVVSNQAGYHGTRIGDRPEDKTEDLFCAVQDFLNVYDREALNPFDFLPDDYVPDLDGPYYEMRCQFIIKAMRDIPEA